MSEGRSHQALMREQSPFAFLQQSDTHFLVDDSQTMFGNDWLTAKEALLAAASYCAQHDTCNFSISFLHHKPASPSVVAKGYTDVNSEATVQSIFQNVRTALKSSRPTGMRLMALLDDYFARFSSTPLSQDQQGQVTPRPLKIITITNGIPTDDLASALASVELRLQSSQDEMNPNQVSIEFWQVGRNGPTTNFFYKTGKLRSIPSVSAADTQQRPRWKYDPTDSKKAGPSKSFLKYMTTNLLQSRFISTSSQPRR